MILYDRNFMPIAISQDILNFLGYEDIDDFRTYATDIADLFVKKSGYIYKYDNFSWISYVLHSGAPSKSALVKLKGGNEKEIWLSIKELFLFQDDENSPYYAVNIQNLSTATPKSSQESHIFIEEEVAKASQKEDNAILSTQESKNNSSIEKKSTKQVPAKPFLNESDKDMFIEDISADNLSFLQSLELPKAQKIDKEPSAIKKSKKKEQETSQNKNEANGLIQEFLDYNDSIGLELLNAVTQKEMKSIKKYVMELESIAQILDLENLSASLDYLKNADSQKVHKAFENYQNSLQKIREGIE